jgi:hypothetical protein
MRGSLIIATLLIALAAVTKCKGELYETPAQFETGKPSQIKQLSHGVTWWVWTGKRVRHEGYFDPDSFGNKCVMEVFSFRDRHPITMPEIVKFIGPYLDRGMTVGTVSTDDAADYVYLIDRDGNKAAVMMYQYGDKSLSVMTNQVWTQVFERNQNKAKLRVKQSRNTAPQVQTKEPPTGTFNDCLIVATEMYARLKTTAVWARVAQFKLYDTDGKPIRGHAAVFYQPTEGSTVFVYDKRMGSLDLHTTSHEIDEILIALNLALMKDGYPKAEQGEWVGQ